MHLYFTKAHAPQFHWFELTKDRKQRHFVVGNALDRQAGLFPSAQAALDVAA
jgi:hypothetical protein